ncbi:MAG TPA: hydantoinase/oxoprolinase family protein [Candidatus Latescibacteria bacterium]|nr:hydantoinase/oxoprolinase family protein [Candidatus Latescibacterota bacterium]
MPIALGLDAGGTYTDAVLYDLSEDRILASAKAPTTPPSYIEGVAGAIAGLPAAIRSRATYAALSTTLATNAIVEGRHAPAGLVLIGYDGFEAREVRWQPKRVVAGRHTIRGVESEPLDETGLRVALTELLEEGVSGIAISSVLSVRNPEHELRAAEIANELTELPIVCGHEVAGVLNALVRAETAALNAGLIPIVQQFLHAVEGVLSEVGLSAIPCFMVTGDGSLMATRVARLRPVETILSGPACSALGAARLSGVAEGIVVDVGGTTTDIAVLRGGRPSMAPGGVSVGEWRAGVRSADVCTRGLGGDSSVAVQHGKLSVGPQRVIPVSYAGHKCAALREEYRELLERVNSDGSPGGDWRLTNPTDAFLRLQSEARSALEDQEKAILDALENGPKTRWGLAKAVGYPHQSLLRTERLERWRLIQRVGLTPTDIWHVTGQFEPWDKESARIATELAAARLGVSAEEVVARVGEIATQMLTRQVMHAYFGVPDEGNHRGAHTLESHLTRIVLREVPRNGLGASLNLRPPIIGVGAPAHLFLSSVSDRLGGTFVLPEGAPVANAVGAATGAVVATATALLRPEENGSIVCYTPEKRISTADRERAIAVARDVLVPLVQEELRKKGAVAASVTVRVEHFGAEVKDVPDPIWWESTVTVRGMGHPFGADGNRDDGLPDVVFQEEWVTPGLKEAEQRSTV